MMSASKLASIREAKRRSGLRCTVDLHGLASVFLVLLLVLMAPILSRPDLPTHGVDLVESRHAVPVQGALREDAITIQVSRDGNVYFRGRQVRSRDLRQAIRDAVRNGSNRTVYLSIDMRARYGDVEPVIEQIRRAGLSDAVILANKVQ